MAVYLEPKRCVSAPDPTMRTATARGPPTTAPPSSASATIPPGHFGGVGPRPPRTLHPLGAFDFWQRGQNTSARPGSAFRAMEGQKAFDGRFTRFYLAPQTYARARAAGPSEPCPARSYRTTRGPRSASAPVSHRPRGGVTACVRLASVSRAPRRDMYVLDSERWHELTPGHFQGFYMV